MEPTGGGGYVLKSDPSVKVGSRLMFLPAVSVGCPADLYHVPCIAACLQCTHCSLLPRLSTELPHCPSCPAQVTSRAHKMSKSRGNVINPDDVVRCLAVLGGWCAKSNGGSWVGDAMDQDVPVLAVCLLAAA